MSEQAVIHKVFNNAKFNELMSQVLLINESVLTQDNEALNTTILGFFTNVQSGTPSTRDRSTGRKPVLKSEEARIIFGDKMSELMYAVMHKLTNHMTSTFTYTVLFFFSFFCQKKDDYAIINVWLFLNFFF